MHSGIAVQCCYSQTVLVGRQKTNLPTIVYTCSGTCILYMMCHYSFLLHIVVKTMQGRRHACRTPTDVHLGNAFPMDVN